jgi:hypothetical protein
MFYPTIPLTAKLKQVRRSFLLLIIVGNIMMAYFYPKTLQGDHVVGEIIQFVS